MPPNSTSILARAWSGLLALAATVFLTTVPNALAQPSAQPDLTAFPSVERVREVLQDADEARYLAKLDGAFHFLEQLVYDLYRRPDGTNGVVPPEAHAVAGPYGHARRAVFPSASSPEVEQRARALQDEYVVRSAYRMQVFETFFSQDWRDVHLRPILAREGRAAASVEAHRQRSVQENQRRERDEARAEQRAAWSRRAGVLYVIAWLSLPATVLVALLASGLGRPVRADPANPLILRRSSQRADFATGIVADIREIPITEGEVWGRGNRIDGSIRTRVRQEIHLDTGGGTHRAFTLDGSNIQLTHNHELTFLWFTHAARPHFEMGPGVAFACNHTLGIEHTWHWRVRQCIKLAKAPGFIAWALIMVLGVTLWLDIFILPHVWLACYFLARKLVIDQRLRRFLADDFRRIIHAVNTVRLRPRTPQPA